MANTAAYMAGRKKYGRPQAALWADNPGTLVNSDPANSNSPKIFVPAGTEIGSDQSLETNTTLQNSFIILSDHNRSDISVSPMRIEKRERTINGRMRSYHVADKLKFDITWTNLPSRSHSGSPNFNSSGVSALEGTAGEYTVDGGAGGNELLDWYESHQGSFWMYLAYDKYKEFKNTDNPYGHLHQYNQIVEVYFADFKYSISKRGKDNFDFWTVSVSLEEA
jgi:hypothetical protein